MDEPKPKKPNNLRTGLLLAALALFFFVMLFVKRLWLS
ncbi:cytochrome oxidase small assembly protein [Massilia horti]|nr:cytochrome oxidase small assembly protein [Massilia horti]